MYVCICKGIREETVRDLGRKGVRQAHELAEALGLAQPDCCGRCLRSIHRFVALAAGEPDDSIPCVTLAERGRLAAEPA